MRSQWVGSWGRLSKAENSTHPKRSTFHDSPHQEELRLDGHVTGFKLRGSWVITEVGTEIREMRVNAQHQVAWDRLRPVALIFFIFHHHQEIIRAYASNIGTLVTTHTHVPLWSYVTNIINHMRKKRGFLMDKINWKIDANILFAHIHGIITHPGLPSLSYLVSRLRQSMFLTIVSSFWFKSSLSSGSLAHDSSSLFFFLFTILPKLDFSSHNS